MSTIRNDGVTISAGMGPEVQRYLALLSMPGGGDISSGYGLSGIGLSCLSLKDILLYDYHRTSASFNKRCGIGEVVIATAANCSTMACRQKRRLNR